MNEGAGMKMAAVAVDIMIRSVSTAIEMDIMESGTGRGSIRSIGRGSSRSRMGTGIGSGSATVRERGSSTRHEGTIGTETMVALVEVVVGRHAWRGNSTRNIGGTMIGATSSGAMMNVVTIEGVKRAHLLVGEGVEAEVVEHGKTLAVALRQRGGR